RGATSARAAPVGVRFSHQRVDRLISGAERQLPYHLQLEGRSNERRMVAPISDQRIVKTATITQPTSAWRESHARNQDCIYLTESCWRTALWIRLSYPPYPRHSLELGVADSMQRQVAAGKVDARQHQCATPRLQRSHELTGIEFAAEGQVGEHAVCVLELGQSQQTRGNSSAQ